MLLTFYTPLGNTPYKGYTIMNKKNPIVKDLHSSKYRSRIIQDKRPTLRDEQYDWVAELYEEQDAQTEQATRQDEDVQSSDDS
tara:strand:- start:423 stop:671 length:249 start_codon:yes stop_codon:yes gene_type:complete